MQSKNGVIDILVADEAQACKRQSNTCRSSRGASPIGSCADQASLRRAVPENRVRAYDVRQVMQGLADTGTLLELRASFGDSVLTALARIEGRPIGLLASNPSSLGGAIDADAADKAARFMQLCDAHGLPIVSLIDTPGFMVGPDIETRAQVRHVSRMFVTAAQLRVPFFAVVLRKGYGLGAMAMAGGGMHAPVSTSPGRPANSARWASKARCAWATARNSKRCRQGPNVTRSTSGSSRSSTKTARPSAWPKRSRSTQ